MFDLTVPTYVWGVLSIVLVLREIRHWFDMVLEYDMRDQEFKHECEQDAKDREVPENVKRMFS